MCTCSLPAGSKSLTLIPTCLMNTCATFQLSSLWSLCLGLSLNLGAFFLDACWQEEKKNKFANFVRNLDCMLFDSSISLHCIIELSYCNVCLKLLYQSSSHNRIFIHSVCVCICVGEDQALQTSNLSSISNTSTSDSYNNV